MDSQVTHEKNLNDEIIKMYKELRKLQSELAELAKEFYKQSVISYDEVSGTPTELSFFNNDMNFISKEEVDQKIESIPPIDDSNYLKKDDEDSQECFITTTFADLKTTTKEEEDCSDSVATTEFVHQLVKNSSEDAKEYFSGIYQSNKGVTEEYVKDEINKAIEKYDEEENVEQQIADAIAEIDIPDSTSDLQNDSGFITINDVPGDLVTSVNGQIGDVNINIPTVPTNVSAFTNDAGYITDPGVTSVNNQTGAVSIQENVQANWNSTTGPSAILNKPALKRIATTADYDDLENVPSFATVATSGSYNDLADTPTIPVDSNLVHKDGNENITGEKTFVGTKRVKFKQGTNTDKLGFTCYTRSNVECGNFEVLPNDRAVNLGIYDITNKPASDWVVGFKCQVKDSNGTMHKFGLRAPSRLGNATYTEYYIPASVNGVYADRTGNISLDTSSGVEVTSNKVTSISASSTDDEYPTAKCVYDAINNMLQQLQQS